VINLAVIFGGKSCEHEISILTANQIIACLNKEKYRIIPIYITKDQRFYRLNNFNINLFKDRKRLKKSMQEISFTKKGFMAGRKKNLIDVAILSMHGTNGEDGSIQALLNFFDICYLGSDLISCALSQDKVFMKQILKQNDVKVLDYQFLYEKEKTDFILNLQLPVIVKACNLGSSIGIEIIRSETELKEKLHTVFRYDKKVLFEPYIADFREFNIAVCNFNREIICSKVEEVKKTNDILDFTNKYQGSKDLRIIPAEIDSGLQIKIEEIAKKVYSLMDFETFVRFDFMYFNNELYLNEVNTTPGSLSYYLWDKSFNEMLDIKIKDSFRNFSERNEKETSFDTNIIFTGNGSKK